MRVRRSSPNISTPGGKEETTEKDVRVEQPSRLVTSICRSWLTSERERSLPPPHIIAIVSLMFRPYTFNTTLSPYSSFFYNVAVFSRKEFK